MRRVARRRFCALLTIAVCAVAASSLSARAEPLKILTAGAFKQVLLAVLPQMQAAGHDVQWQADTVGALVKRIDGGESFDIVFASPAALKTLHAAGKVGDTVDLARVGVGVAVKQGALKPDLSSVAAFTQMLRGAKSVAYIDPAAGGTSGIYIAGLIDRLGIGDEVRAKSILVKGGYSADRVASGEADIAIQQISELLPVKGVEVAGPLPPEIQSYTIYSGAVASGSSHNQAAQALLALLRGHDGAAVIASKGMEPIPPRAAAR